MDYFDREIEILPRFMLLFSASRSVAQYDPFSGRPPTFVMRKPVLEEDIKPFEKTTVDHVVNILLKAATVPTEAQTASSASFEQLQKKAIMLLKAALQGNSWGQTATVKTQW